MNMEAFVSTHLVRTNVIVRPGSGVVDARSISTSAKRTPVKTKELALTSGVDSDAFVCLVRFFTSFGLSINDVMPLIQSVSQIWAS